MNFMDEQPNTLRTLEKYFYIRIKMETSKLMCISRNLFAKSSSNCFAFGKGRSTITEHIANVFKEGELDENLVCRESD
jgi:hypothetical protein